MALLSMKLFLSISSLTVNKGCQTLLPHVCQALEGVLWLTPYYPFMTFKPSNALHYGQGFFLLNLVVIQHS